VNELANRFDAQLKTMNGRMDSFESTLQQQQSTTGLSRAPATNARTMPKAWWSNHQQSPTPVVNVDRQQTQVVSPTSKTVANNVTRARSFVGILRT